MNQLPRRIWVIPEGAVCDNIPSTLLEYLSVHQEVARILKLMNEKVDDVILEDVLRGVAEALGEATTELGGTESFKTHQAKR